MLRSSSRPYLLALLLAAAVVYLPVVLWAWYDEAPSGDLARIGAWSERHYGWRDAQPAVPVRHNRLDAPDAQVWVLGDSFSMGNVWQSVWADQAGLRVYTQGWNGHGCLDAFIDRALAAEQAQVRHIVVQTIERHLLDRLGTSPHCPPAGPLPIEGPPGTTAPHRASWTLQPGQAEGLGFLGVWPLVDWRHLWKSAQNQSRVPPIHQPPGTVLTSGDTLNAPLQPAALFSSRRPDRLLYYLGDESKRSWQPAQLQAAAAHAGRIQARLQAQGKHLTLLIVPDKSSVYRPWMLPPHRLPAVEVEAAFAQAGVPVLYPLAAMTEAARHQTDFYLPNDTHLSPRGFEWLGRLMAQSQPASRSGPR